MMHGSVRLIGDEVGRAAEWLGRRGWVRSGRAGADLVTSSQPRPWKNGNRTGARKMTGERSGDRGGRASTRPAGAVKDAGVWMRKDVSHGVVSVRDVDTHLGTYRGPLRRSQESSGSACGQSNYYKKDQFGNVLVLIVVFPGSKSVWESCRLPVGKA